MSKLSIVSHRDCLDHHPLPGHPECPERLAAALAGIEQLRDICTIEAREATREELARVHTRRHLDRLDRIEQRLEREAGVELLDPDTRAARGSFRAARIAAGAAIQAVESTLNSPNSPAFALTRPPGHHAEADRAMGFCLFNSIAAAAAYALSRPGIRKVAICDFDVHHGNGTESIFSNRREILFVSSHQFPLYPGTGDPHQPVARNVHNAGLPPGSGSNEFRHAWQHDLFDTIDRFGPDLILVSAGFDAHWRDPLAQLQLKDEDFYWIGHQLNLIAQSRARGRLAAVLEGGYDLQALTDSVLAFSEGLGASY